MKGQILHIDDATGEGLISAADGRRYAFGPDDLHGTGQLAQPGVGVDFEVSGTRAVAVYPDPGPLRTAPAGEKNKAVAALLAFFLGGLGVHKFYLGAPGAGAIMAICTLFGAFLLFVPSALMGLVALIEAVIYITRSDEEFRQRYEIGRRAWF